ncbi:hypothetical protein QTG54_004932 [Skeletonema marinoi]|uniref:Macro domain-containing protein n=1 Tax=Skeletonema marinoi TaxID=267567 RepID=A0AAD8YDC7_9STRA|nr:hypothetical protein QTG54_004932 [Skeletonema marinoi]
MHTHKFWKAMSSQLREQQQAAASCDVDQSSKSKSERTQCLPLLSSGGPQPKVQPNRHAHHIMGYVSQWGGMDVGSGMLFSAESIDGLLHQLGGLRFRAECNLVPPHPWAHAYLNQQCRQKAAANNDRNANDTVEVSNIVNSPNPKTKCPVGTAVSTAAVGGEIQSHYDRIIHTVPPFYNYPPSMTEELKRLSGIEIGENEDEEDLHQLSKELLRSCYRQSFHVAFGSNNNDQSYSLLNNPITSFLGMGKYRHNNQQSRHSQRMAVPLLGAGCRDFPKDVALEVAALESASWLLSEPKEEDHATESELVVAFGLLESEDAEALANSIEEIIQLRDAATTD